MSCVELALIPAHAQFTDSSASPPIEFDSACDDSACVPQELTHAVIARLWHEAFDDAKTELSRPGAQHLDLSCRATFACDDGACDDVRPGSKYDPYQIPYRTDCGSFSTFSHDPKRSDNQLPARPPQPDYYSPTGQMIHKQRLVAILNQCPAMKSKDRLQRIAKVNVG